MKNNLESRETRQGDHDWHSYDYVQAWIEQRQTPGNEQQQIITAVNAAQNPQLKFLDLGAGWGRFSKAILENFPGSSGVAADYSEPMIEAAKQSFAGLEDRISLLKLDISESGSIKNLPTKFDLIFSHQTLHHFDSVSLGRIYGEAREALAPHGQFLNIDRVARPPRVASRIVYRLAGLIPSKFSALRHTRHIDRFAQWFDQKASHQSISTGSQSGDVALGEHLELLRSAGFSVAWVPISPQRFVMKGW
jgi:SAM-dependent methyltransferase